MGKRGYKSKCILNNTGSAVIRVKADAGNRRIVGGCDGSAGSILLRIIDCVDRDIH